MQKWEEPTQKLSAVMILLLIVSAGYSFIVASYIASWQTDTALIGSLIKGVLFLVGFFFIFAIFNLIAKIYDVRYLLVIIIVSFISSFGYPLLVTLNVVGVESFATTNIFPGYGFQAEGLFAFVKFFALQFIYMLIIVPISIWLAKYAADIVIYDTRNSAVYSQKHDKFYGEVFSHDYMLYENDYLEELKTNPNFNTIEMFLQHVDRFNIQPNTKTERFSVYSLPEEKEYIICIKNQFFKLNETESKFVQSRCG